MPERSRRLSTAERVAFWIVLVGMSYLLVEVAAWAGLRFLSASGRLRETAIAAIDLTPQQRQRIETWIDPGGIYYTHSPELGWTVKPHGRSHAYRANSAGIRAEREYDLDPPPGVVRLSCFGESFTHCSDVESDETWQHQLEALDPGLEALNFGVDAYGLDQAFLRYQKDGGRFGSQIVVIGFMSENIDRSLSVFRPFLSPSTGSPFTKPRFVLEGDSVRLVPNPIPRVEGYRALLEDPESMLRQLGTHDHYYGVRRELLAQSRLPSLRLVRQLRWGIQGRDPLSPGLVHGVYDTQSEAYRVTVGVLDAFRAQVLEDGRIPIVLLYPNAFDLARTRQGKSPSYRPLAERLGRQGIHYVDLLDPMSSMDPDDVFGDGGHYSPAGNRKVAETLLAFLRSMDLEELARFRSR